MLVLSGIAIVVFGFLLRVNPLLVVAVAALATEFRQGCIRSPFLPCSDMRSTRTGM